MEVEARFATYKVLCKQMLKFHWSERSNSDLLLCRRTHTNHPQPWQLLHVHLQKVIDSKKSAAQM
jgi:hypothetical protein